MSRSSSGSTKAKNTIVATPAAKKLGHSDRADALRHAAAADGRRVGGATAFIGAARPSRDRRACRMRQRPDVGGDQARARFAEQTRDAPASMPWRPFAIVSRSVARCCRRTASSCRSGRARRSPGCPCRRGRGRRRRRLRTRPCPARPDSCSRSVAGIGQRAHVGGDVVDARRAPPMPVSTLPQAASRLRGRRARSAARDRACRPSARCRR